MDFHPVWPVVTDLAVLLLLAGLPWFSFADQPSTSRPTRVRTIDGLRGFLALGVMFHHGAIYHRYMRDGIWALPPGRGRLFRIAPVHLVAVAGMLVLVMMQSDWQLRVPPVAFARQVAPWLALGLLDFTDINGQVAAFLLLAGVIWSLRYEWLFYLVLPLMAVAAGPGRLWGAIRLLAVAVAIPWVLEPGLGGLSVRDRECAALFLIGMICAAWIGGAGNQGLATAGSRPGWSCCR